MFDPSQPSFSYPPPPPFVDPPYIDPPLIDPPFIDLPFIDPPLIEPPVTSLGSLPLTHLGFQPQASFVQHPNWVVGEAAPVRFGSLAPQTTTVTTTTTTTCSSSQTLRCNICNVDCINRTAFENHLQGKKHINKSQAAAIINSASSRMTNNQFALTLAGAAPELEARKTNGFRSGSAVESVRVCTPCNVICNSEDVYCKHLTGKKHAAQVSLASLGEAGPYFAAIRAQFESNYKKAPKRVKEGQSQWCEVCQISCNSKEVYATHVSGRKHQNNLSQLTADENLEAKSSSSSKLLPPKKASPEEMVEKTRKVVEAGAASSAIRTCNICNVVCNSHTVFEFHLRGQKHKEMLKTLNQKS